jgi:hypothetical protein
VGDAAILARMARNSENAPSEPSGRRRKPSDEGGSHLRQHFRESIRDALHGVDVDELQGRVTLPVPSDVSLLTREVVNDLEVELAKLRAERAELETRRGAAVRSAPARGNGTAGHSAVAWSVARAMEPVAEGVRGSAPDSASGPVAGGSPAPGPPRAQVSPASSAAPGAVIPPAAAPQSAPKSERPGRRRRPHTLTDAELEQVVAPLLAELANLRAEVHELRTDPAATDAPRRPGNQYQMVKLVAGVLIGFALIVAALAVVLKA